MAIKIIEGFENRAEWYGVGEATNIASTNQSLSGDAAVEFGKSSGTQDFAGIAKNFSTPLDLTDPSFKRLFVSVYIPPSVIDAGDLTSVDLIFDKSPGDQDAFPLWENTYECNTTPLLATPAWSLDAGTDKAAAGGGIISWSNGQCAYHLNLSTIPPTGWIDSAPKDYRCAKLRWRNYIAQDGGSFQFETRLNYEGKLARQYVRAGSVNFGGANQTVDTSVWYTGEVWIDNPTNLMWAAFNDNFTPTYVPGITAQLGPNFGQYNLDAGKLSAWDWFRWTRYDVNANFAMIRYPIEDMAEGWNELEIDLSALSFTMGTAIDMSDIDRMGFLFNTLTLGAIEGIVFDELAAETPKEFEEQPVVLFDWTMTEDVVEDFEDLDETVVVSFDELADWVGTGVILSLNTTEKTEGDASLQMDKTSLLSSIATADNSLEIPLDTRNYTKGKIDYFIPSGQESNLASISFTITGISGLPIATLSKTTGFVPGWSTLSFDIHRNSGQLYPGATQDAFANAVQVRIDSLNPVTQVLGFLWDNLRFYGGFDPYNSNTLALTEETSVVSEGTAAQQFNKSSSDVLAGLQKYFDDPIRMTNFRDLIDLDIYLSSEADAAKLNKFFVVLDETEWYARWNLIRDWLRKWNGSVKPINVPLLEDFESAAAWATTDPGVTLVNNTTQFTEGTQSISVDIAAGATNYTASMDKAFVTNLLDYSKLDIDVYIPVAELTKILTLQLILEDSSTNTAIWNLAKIANWNTNSLEPLSPDLTDANFDFTDIDKVRVKYTVHGGTAVTGLSFDNFRAYDGDTWELIGVDHWTVVSNNLQLSLNNSDLSYFETPLDLIPARQGIWVDTEIKVDSGLTNLATAVRINHKGVMSDVQINASTIYISSDDGSYVSYPVDFTSLKQVTVHVNGATSAMRVWIGNTLLYSGNASGIPSSDNSIQIGKISALSSAHNVTFGWIKTWYDKTDIEEPFRVQYEADALPNFAISGPIWSTYGVAGTGTWNESIVSSVYNMDDPVGASGSYGLLGSALTDVLPWGGSGGKEVMRVRFQHPGLGADPFVFLFRSDLSPQLQIALFSIYDGKIRVGGNTSYTEYAMTTTSFIDYLVEIQWGVSVGGGLTDGYIRVWRADTGALLAQHNLQTATFTSPPDQFLWGKLGGSPYTSSPGVYQLDRLWLTHAQTTKSIWEIAATKAGWNEITIDQDNPTIEVGSPSREEVYGYQFYLETNNAIDTLTGVVFDNFRENYVLRLAKHDFIAGDGSQRWEARILEFGNLNKALNEQLGNYSVSDMTVSIENASGFMGELYDTEGIKLANTEGTFRHGVTEDSYLDFSRVFRGIVSTIDFDMYETSVMFNDTMPGLFNRLPNQFITEDSWPGVGTKTKDFVAPVVCGLVSDATGALPAFPVDFEVTVKANYNDWIDFKIIPDGSAATDPTQYSVQIPAAVYTDPLTLAQAAVTVMNSAVTIGVTHFVAAFNEEDRKIQINRNLKPDPADPNNQIPYGDQFEFNWGTGPKSGYSAARTLGFKKEDGGGSEENVADYEAWNVYVIARHFTQAFKYASDAVDLDGAVWIEDKLVGYWSKDVEIIAGTNDAIDYTDDSGTFVAYVAPGVYTDPSTLATAIKAALEATATAQTYTVTYDSSTELFWITLNAPGTTLTMPWSSGPNSATSIGTTIGFVLNDASLTTYIADNEVVFRDEVVFDHERTTDDGLEWTTVTTKYLVAGREDIRVNMRGLTEDNTESGALVTNPIRALEIMLTRFVSFPEDRLNQGLWVEAKDEADRRLLRVDGALINDTEWDSFIEEYCKNFRFDIWPDHNGRLGVRFFIPEISDAEAQPMSDITDIIQESFRYTTNFTQIINRVRFEYRHNFNDDTFLRSGSEVNDDSIQDAKRTYDWPEGTLQMKWVRDTITARRAVATVLDLFSKSNPVAEFELARIGWDFDLTDKINVTHAAAPGTFTNTALSITGRGFNNRLHRLTAIDINLDEYSTVLRFQDMFRLSNRCFFLGDRDWVSSELNWLTASASNREIYGYLCNRDTGVFGDGEPGKRLC